MRTIVYGNEYMKLHDNGYITRPEIGMHTPSEQWRVVGAVSRNNWGQVTKRYLLSDVLERPESIPWHFKNGKQRTRIIDFDHGTHREWHSPKHWVR